MRSKKRYIKKKKAILNGSAVTNKKSRETRDLPTSDTLSHLKSVLQPIDDPQQKIAHNIRRDKLHWIHQHMLDGAAHRKGSKRRKSFEWKGVSGFKGCLKPTKLIDSADVATHNTKTTKGKIIRAKKRGISCLPGDPLPPDDE